MAELNDLFTGNLDSTMDFLNEKKEQSADGLYRVDLSKCADRKKGWRSTLRFLPNLTKEGKVGGSAIEKIAHYVDIKSNKELSGFFDSPKSFGKSEKCDLTDTYYALMNSKNAILQERAKMLKYSKKYYSYVLVIKDEQNPDLVGKIMIFQYGKQIKDKILAEHNGEITGVNCNVFDLSTGKDFELIVKEIQTGAETFPDYKMSFFKQESTALPMFIKDKAMFKNIPLGVDGKIDPKYQTVVKDFLLDREHDLEEYSPKRLDEAQQSKVSEIINFLTGKASSSFQSSKTTHGEAKSNDFEFESNFNSPPKATEEETEDDFFSDLG